MAQSNLLKQIAAFILINGLFLIYGFDLKQRNPEELFLSDQSFQELKNYEKHFGRDDLTFVAGLNDKTQESLKTSIEKIQGEFVSLEMLFPHHAVFKLPTLPDEEKFSFFQSLSELDPDLRFAGMSYTNAALAGMSLRIQHVLFPIIFVVMFICLFFIFYDLPTTLYLFITSFVGVSVGLALVKLFFSYSSILTALTPLVSFILTLATQLHTVFGLEVYQNKKDFFHYKLTPLLIMMGTTIIGFLGLMTSELESIRQFGLVTAIALTITWGLNLLFLSRTSLNFKIPTSRILYKIKRPGFNPILGIFIPLFLLALGFFSLSRMPILVEALFFFPKNHPVRIGHEEITKNLGGTSQIELVLEKNDQSELSFEDFKQISTIEKQLQTRFEGIKFLSINELIETANFLYSQNRRLPEDRVAYLIMKNRLPKILKNSLGSDHAYKISFLTKALSNQEREDLAAKLKNELSALPQNFSYKITGLNHLLLQSQSTLVTTLIKSLLSSFLLIALIFSFFARNIKEIVTFSLISLSAIFGGLFVMDLFGFTLNVASIMTLSISIGLVDDSTIHLIYANKHGESEDVIRRSCLIPMMLSHFVLFISFCVLGFEPFVLIREFALGLVVMLTMGLLLDLFVLPMLEKNLRSLDP